MPKEVISILNNWTLENYTKEFFNVSQMNHLGTRHTTRQCSNRNVDHLFDYPQTVYNVQSKISTDFGLDNFKKAKIGKNGIVTGIGFKGDYIFEHNDPIWVPNTQTYHFNFISQKPVEGGVTVINNVPHDIDSGDLLIYNVSKCQHRVTETVGNIPRILYVFGFCIDTNKINDIFEQFILKSKQSE